MNKSRFLALSFLLTVTGFGSAYAQAPALAAGTYKLAIGANTPCDVNVTAEGAFTPTEGCPTSNVTKWKATSTSYELITASGTVYAVLKPQGEDLTGTTFADQRKITVSR